MQRRNCLLVCFRSVASSVLLALAVLLATNPALAQTSESRTIADGTEPAWSPDGQWILISVPTGEQRDLFVVRPDPTWSPDGSALAYALVTRGRGNDQVMIVSVPEQVTGRRIMGRDRKPNVAIVGLISGSLVGGSTGAVPKAAPPAAGESCPPTAAATALRGIAACLEEVSFVSEGLTLAGQWLTPRGGGPFPAAVVIRGSGESVRGNPWTEMLAAVLVEMGVGVLVPDKRGSGESEGDWRMADFVDLAGDAIAAVGYLSSRPDVMPDRIGVMGLSQGGQIAPIAAARSGSVAFVINIVGAAVPFLENVRFEMLHTFEEEGLAGAELDAAMNIVDAAVAYLSGSWSWDAYAGALQEARAVLGDAITDEHFIHTPDHWRWDFFRRLADFDPADWWRRVNQPVLVVLGKADRNTPTTETASRLRQIFAEIGHPDATVLVFEGLGHDLIDHSAPGPMSEHGLRADVRDALGSWVRRLVSR